MARNNSDGPQWTQEELVQLGLVEAPAAAETPAKPAETPAQPAVPHVVVSPTPRTADDNSALAAALEKLSAKLDAPAKPAETPEPEPTIEDLVAAGRIDEAILAAKKSNESTIAQVLPLIASTSKQLFAQRINAEHGNGYFEKWYPLMQQELQRRNMSEGLLATPDNWNEMLNLTKSLNLQVWQEEIAAGVRAEVSRNLVSSGSRGESSFIRQATQEAGLSAYEAEIARDMYVQPKAFAQSKQICEKYVDHIGDVRGVPLINRDITNRDGFNDVVVKPGEF